MTEVEVVELLKNKNITIGSAESLTGGLFASTISSVPGVSKVYKGSIISYSTLIKESVLKIQKDLINQVGVVSKEIAYFMAKNVHELLDVDLAISFTGNAGPDAMENKPVGLVYIGIYYQGQVEVKECHFHGTRNEIRSLCVQEGFKMIYQKII